MLEINPHKIKKAEIVVGIPSFNESDTIFNVVKQVDAGLKKYFNGRKAVIINADNNSPDNTKEVFLHTKTKTPKIYISTPPRILGKGNNLHNVFLKIKDLGAVSSMLVDGDVKSLTPEWIQCLIAPIFKGYDYVSPIYERDKQDGSITNHICFPLVYGLLGYNIRQPIAGEVAFSESLVEYWLKQKWSEQVRRFGIDIFMCLNAIKGGFKLCRVDLGVKVHKFSGPDLANMFLEVVGPLFELLWENKNLWQKKISFSGLPLVCRIRGKKRYSKLKLDHKQFAEEAFSEFSVYYSSIKKYISPEVWRKIEEMFLSKEKSLYIDSNLWIQIVYEMFYQYNISLNKEDIIKFLRVFYWGRIASFIKETSRKNSRQAEEIVQKQAQRFYRRRSYLLQLTGNFL